MLLHAALDLGAVMRWKNWEVGAGVADLFAELIWSNSQVDRYAYDPVDDLVLLEREAVWGEPEAGAPNNLSKWRPNSLPRASVACFWRPCGSNPNLGEA